MKKYLCCFFLLLASLTYGQTQTTNTLDKNTIVKDADGTRLSYDNWRELMKTGDYNLRRTPGSSEYLLYKLTDVEKAALAEARKSMKTSSAYKPMPSPAFIEGTPFKGEKISDINGNKFDLRNNKDKIVVLNFWFINCAPCRQEIPELNELVKQYKDNKNVVFIAIALDQRSALKDFLRKTPFDYNIVDEGREYVDKYGVKAYPTHVVIGKDGLIKFSALGLGANTVSWVEKTIKEEVAKL